MPFRSSEAAGTETDAAKAKRLNEEGNTEHNRKHYETAVRMEADDQVRAHMCVSSHTHTHTHIHTHYEYIHTFIVLYVMHIRTKMLCVR